MQSLAECIGLSRILTYSFVKLINKVCSLVMVTVLPVYCKLSLRLYQVGSVWGCKQFFSQSVVCAFKLPVVYSITAAVTTA